MNELLKFPPSAAFFDVIFIPLVIELGKSNIVNGKNCEEPPDPSISYYFYFILI